MLADLVRSLVADIRQRFFHTGAFTVTMLPDGFQSKDAGIDTGTHHRRIEASALLVRPHGQLHRRIGLHLVVVQSPHDLETRENAVNTVEPAAGWLAVQMTTGADGRPLAEPTRASREDIADFVHAHFQPGLLAPSHE